MDAVQGSLAEMSLAAGGPASAPAQESVIVAQCVWRGEQLGTIAINAASGYDQVLEYLSHEINCRVISLAYRDEDGDRIDVKGQQCYENFFIAHYNWMQQDASTSGPILLELETEKPSARKRNVLGLTVDTAQQGANPPDFGSQFGNATQQQALDITESDIEVLNQLGNGNGGTVFKCLHTPSQNVMALKVIPLDANAKVQKQILAELEILHRCDSPYIIRYFGSFFKENRIMMCTEFMNAGSMEGLGKVPEHIIGRVSVAVLRGLSYLQGLRIMHRDIKPSNILMDSSGQIKLCDFGVSTQLDMSITATYVGTNAYMAPERVRGTPYTVRSEVWSLGLSLVELAVGRFPYPADNSSPSDMTPIDLLQCIVHEQPPRLPRSEFSAEFADFTEQSLVRDASKRPTPTEIMSHPFVVYHDRRMTNNSEFINWVEEVLKKKAQVLNEQQAANAQQLANTQQRAYAQCASPPPGSHGMFHREPQYSPSGTTSVMLGGRFNPNFGPNLAATNTTMSPTGFAPANTSPKDFSPMTFSPASFNPTQHENDHFFGMPEPSPMPGTMFF